MSPLRRYIIVVPLSLIGGWLAGRALRMPSPAAPSAAAQPTMQVPAKLPQPEWRQWLNQASPLPPLETDINGLWSQAAASKQELPLRQQLWLDELLFGARWEILAAFFEDARFCDFARSYDPTEAGDSSWRTRVLETGADNAMAVADKLPSVALKVYLLQKLLPLLAREAPEKGFAWLQKTESTSPRNLGQFLGEVIKINPDMATKLWQGMKPGKEMDQTSLIMLLGLREKDWKEGVAWVEANLPASKRMDMIKNMLEWGRPQERAALYDNAADIKNPEVRSLLYSLSLPDRSQSPNELVAAAIALPKNSLNAEGWREMGGESAWFSVRKYSVKEFSTEPVEFVRTLRALADQVPPEHRQTYLEGAAQRSAYINFQVGAQLVEFLDTTSMEGMAKNWTQKDPTAASAWLATLEPSAKRDAAVAAFCQETATVEPAAAAQWALSVSDPEKQTATVQDVLGAWRQTDPASAAAWSATHGVTPSPANAE